QRGGDIAAEYIAAQFALYGLKPAGDNGSYLQKVPLVGITPGADTHFTLVPANAQSSNLEPTNTNGTTTKVWTSKAKSCSCWSTSRPRTIRSFSPAKRSLTMAGGSINTKKRRAKGPSAPFSSTRPRWPAMAGKSYAIPIPARSPISSSTALPG